MVKRREERLLNEYVVEQVFFCARVKGEILTRTLVSVLT